MEGSRGWRWRPKGARPAAEASLLLYEPGNRGDLLKAAWLLEVAGASAEGAPHLGAAAAVVDICAGAPSYPLSAEARSRRERAPERLRRALIAASGEERWPSSGLFLHSLRCALGATGALLVFDRDPERRAAWEGIAEVLAGESGERVLAALPSPPPALVLVDPYDLFHRWGAWQDAIARAAPAPVLLYLLNKSPRGAGHADQYRRLRRALSTGDPPLIGRLAADEREPRALHEVWLLAPPALRRTLREPLAAATEALAACFPGSAGLPLFEG